ncbi:MAG: bifunctional chorismate mutase/prephenate dehydrogenase [Succinivibrio sp.]|nr:bifunctional chorismate mutase/prephenate dehydrogenase [Succinivibrio sp.]
MSAAELEKIREEINDTDRELVRLLKKRFDLVSKATVSKKDYGEQVYSRERETYVVSSAEKYAQENGLPSGLLSDVMKRLLRESYKICSDTVFSYPKTLREDGDIVIVGGNGGMGRIFTRYFEASGYRVFSFGHRGWDKAPQYLKNAKVVIVTVPIDVTVDVIKQLSPLLREDQILCDFTSVKAPIVDAMMKYHKGPVLGLHPMFGPDIRSLVKQVIVTVPERDEKASEFLVEQFRIWGAKIFKSKAKDHDRAMSIIQALRHFGTYSYGSFLKNLNPNLKRLIDLSSPIYRMELMMVGRLFAQDPRLYADIIMASDANVDLIRNFVKSLADDLKIVEDKNVDAFTENFIKIREFFGEFSDEAFKESGALLAKLQDERS